MVLKTSNFPVDILKATVQNNLSAWEPEAWTVARDWQDVVAHFLKTASARALGQFVQSRLAAGALIYPSQPFRALLLTPLNRVRVVILGQDPYHSPGQAEGLAFSVAPGKNLPPSLRNIYKELARDQAVAPKTARYNNGSLIRWAEQGVLLLNTCLTVEDGLPASHANRGWEVLTDEIIKTVWSSQSPVVFLLWGARAQTKRALLIDLSKDTVTAKRHLVLSANHPSPLSAMRAPLPFIGCGHFGQTNSFLAQQGLDLIDW